MELDEKFFAQPGELKIIDDFGNVLTGEQALKYSEKRKYDVGEKLKKRGIENYLHNGMVVQINGQETLYSIVGRFVYDKNQVMYDYKVTEYDVDSENSYLINHEQVTKAFMVENKRVK